MGVEEALWRLLRGGRCVGVAEAAALLRATPGEVVEAARRLEERGAARLLGWRVCGSGPRGGGVRRGVRLLRLRGGVVVAVEARGAGLPALVRAARRAAGEAARLVRGGAAAAAVPVVVWRRDRGLVEGVPVVSAAALEELEGVGGFWEAVGVLRERFGALLRLYRRGMEA